MKRLGLVLVLLLVLALGAGAYWWLTQPGTATEAFEKASKTEARLEEDLRLARDAYPPDAAEIARLELEIRDNWARFVQQWPDSPEADDARYRLLNIDLAAAQPGQSRLDLIDQFLEAHPGHAKEKDLLWRKAEILRDEIKDPLVAVEAFRAIEEKYPDDPIAPKAALAAARIYDSIDEPAAAAQAYAELAEAYPDSPEAQQALMRQAALLEEKLGKKKEAADVYRDVAESNPGSAMGRRAQGQRRKLLGELGEGEQEEYYQQTYQQAEFAPYDISQEDYNHPTRKKIREQGFDVEHYDVNIRLDPEKKELTATTTIRALARKPLAGPLLLELNPMLEVSAVSFRSPSTRPGETEPVSFDHKDEFLEMVIPGGESASEADPQPYELTVAYRGGVETWTSDGLTTEALSLWGETRWYPQTSIGDVYSQAVTVEYPKGYEAVAQGERLGKPEKTGENGWLRSRFEQSQPAQFMTVAIGRFEVTRFEGPGGLPMEILVAPGHEQAAKVIRESMESSVRIYNDLLGPFPFDKLAVSEVPEFPGGYGSASLILMGTIMFTEEAGGPEKILAHEIAHQWFGNLLGLNLQDGSIPWLSEGFATYCDAIFTERTVGRQAFLNQIRKMGNFYRQNVLLFEDRPISQTLWRSPMYRSLMYEKGALVLHELRREIGDDSFFRLFREYVAENQWKIVRIRDFSDKASEVAGRDLDWFFEQTLDRTGYPTVEVVQALAEPREGKAGRSGAAGDGPWSIDLTLKQSDPAYRMSLELAIDLEGGKVHRETIDLSKLRMETKIETPGKPEKIRLDPDGWYLLGGGLEAMETQVAIAGEAPEPVEPTDKKAAAEADAAEPADSAGVPATAR